MNEHDPGPDLGDATWAHNRWPTIGLYTGAGVGAVLGIMFLVGWLWTILYIVTLAITGCIVGLVAAKVTFWGSPQGPIDLEPAETSPPPLPDCELEPATEDHEGDAAPQDAARGDDDADGVSGSEIKPQQNRE